jgi:anaerobic magnesium-protoporphyrin IX monomethyl ester cyclase
MKILLVGELLAHRSFNGANKALPVLASSLHKAGFGRAVQMDLERPDLSIDDVCREATDADLVVFAGCLTPQWPELDDDCQRVACHLAGQGRSDVPIIVGGYAAKSVEDIARLSPWITAYFDGEGEEAIVDIAAAVKQGTFADAMHQIDGLNFLTSDGRFHRSIASRVLALDPYDQHFDFVHVPGVHNMDIFRSPDERQLKTAQLFTQRGCPFSCSFCNKSMEANLVGRVSPARLREQLHDLRDEGFEAIYLDVDTFTVNEQLAKDEARILKEEGFVWGSNTRIDKISLELMKYFRDCNCVYMFFGVEHCVTEVLLAVNKFNGPLHTQLERAERYPRQVQRVFADMAQAGLPSSYFIILGLPKADLDDTRTEVVGYSPTTFEDDMAAIRFGLNVCEPDYLNFNLLRFMPGSAAADIPNHPAYSCVRPTGSQPVTAGQFLPRVAKTLGYHVPANHGVYRLCESVGMNQPTTTAMDAERVHRSILEAMTLINDRIRRGLKPTKLFVDRELLDAGLVTRDERGCYGIAPLREFERL